MQTALGRNKHYALAVINLWQSVVSWVSEFVKFPDYLTASY